MYLDVSADFTFVWLNCRDLFQNIFSGEVYEEYQRRCTEAGGKAWSSGMIPEVFLDKVLGEDQRKSMLLPPEAASRQTLLRQLIPWHAVGASQPLNDS